MKKAKTGKCTIFQGFEGHFSNLSPENTDTAISPF